MDRRELLQVLPPFSNRSVTIRANQTVGDIVKEVLAAHQHFAPDYDVIAAYFDQESNTATAKALFRFLKQNVHYRIESEAKQTTKSPAAILATGEGDCKHYSGFIAGVLDALKRRGRKIKWNYRFASYNAFDEQPGHVFVVLNEGGREYWIDPVLKTFDERLEPVYILDKSINTDHMLQRVSGIEDNTLLYDEDENLAPEIVDAIALLLKYGILNTEGQVNDMLLLELSKTLPDDEFELISKARVLLHSATVGGFFSNVWRGIKKVTLAAPRNAYLSLVALNVFGAATKLYNCIYNKDGSYNESGKSKLKIFWQDRLGGEFSKLENTVKYGSKKQAILGQAKVSGPEIPAWVATASAIIAAISPLISDILKSQGANGQLPANINPLTGLPYGMNPGNTPPGGNNGLMDFVEQNPAIVVAVAAGAVYFLTKKKRSRA